MVEKKKDYIDVTSPRSKTVVQRFKQALDTAEAECTREHRPFDYFNAKRDYQDLIDNLEKQAERLPSGSGELELPPFDFDKYSKADRFQLIATSEITEDALLEGIKQKILTAYVEEFVVKDKGNRVSVFVPVNVYRDRNKKVVGK